MKRLGILLVFVLLLICGSAFSGVINVPGDLSTIQAGINSAVHYDTVLVAPGVYYETLNFRGKLIVVKSSDGPLVTTITNSSSSVNLVLFTNNETSETVLEGFSLLGGWGAILCENAGPTIKNNILQYQNITNWGAISLGGDGYGSRGNSPAVIINNTIVHCANGAISTFSMEMPTIKNNIIAFNGHYAIHRQSRNYPHPDLEYNNFYGNRVLFQNIVDTSDGNIYVDPMFDTDFSLTSGSPCIDAGDPDVMYNDPDGSRNDMGAWPYGDSGPDMYVAFDIKPGSCPNPLNIKPDKNVSKSKDGMDNAQQPDDKLSKSVLPVAILGTDDFDVNEIDFESIKLNGVPAIRFGVEDVAEPVDEMADDCECNEYGADGYDDLTIKFDKAEIISSIDNFDDEFIELTISGELFDGTTFEGYDCVWIKDKKSLVAVTDPAQHKLRNHPNPFNPSTEISFNLPQASKVQIEIININGRRVNLLVDRFLTAGNHSYVWDGDNSMGQKVASGIYFYRFVTDSFTQTKKMVLMK